MLLISSGQIVIYFIMPTRTKSFFDNSELSSQKLPSKAELKILNKYKGRIPNEVFNTVYSPPNTEK